MTSAHHPGPIHHRAFRSEFKQHHEWLWIGLSIVLVVALAGVVALVITRESESATTAPLVAHTNEYNNDATTGRIASPGVTTQYFGNSGALFPEAAASEYDHDTTTGRIASPGVTTQYFGNSEEISPEK